MSPVFLIVNLEHCMYRQKKKKYLIPQTYRLTIIYSIPLSLYRLIIIYSIPLSLSLCLSLCLSVMDLLQKLLNIVLLPLTLTVILFLLPPFLFLKYLFSLKRNICSENVANKVVLITGASSGIGEVCSKLSISHLLIFVDINCLLYYVLILYNSGSQK